MFTGIIYCATSPSNKKYYGLSLKSLDERKQKHFLNMSAGSKLTFYNALRKYGFENFKWEIIEEYKLEIKKELIYLLYKREIYWIEKDKTYDIKNGYNISHGGSGGDIFSILSDERKKEIKSQLSNSGKDVWQDEEYRAKMINIRNTEDFHNKISKKAKEQWKDPETRAKSMKSFRTDIWDNPERNKKISDKLKAKPKEKCKYCGFETNNAANLKRWHNENCKFKP